MSKLKLSTNTNNIPICIVKFWTFLNWYIILIYSFGNDYILFIRIILQIKWLSNNKLAKNAADSVTMNERVQHLWLTGSLTSLYLLNLIVCTSAGYIILFLSLRLIISS